MHLHLSEFGMYLLLPTDYSMNSHISNREHHSLHPSRSFLQHDRPVGHLWERESEKKSGREYMCGGRERVTASVWVEEKGSV